MPEKLRIVNAFDIDLARRMADEAIGNWSGTNNKSDVTELTSAILIANALYHCSLRMDNILSALGHPATYNGPEDPAQFEETERT